MLNYQGSAVLKTDTLHIAVHLGKPRDQIFSNHQESKQVVLAFSTENIYLQEMKSITYLATYMFRLQKQVVCSFVESSTRFKKEKQQFLSTRWTCLQCEQSGGTICRWLRLYKKREAIEHTCTELNRLMAKEQRQLQSEEAPMQFTKEFRGVCFCTVLFILDSFKCLHKLILYPYEQRERARSAETPQGCHTQSDSESQGTILHSPRQWLWPWMCISLQDGNTR